MPSRLTRQGVRSIWLRQVNSSGVLSSTALLPRYLNTKTKNMYHLSTHKHAAFAPRSGGYLASSRILFIPATHLWGSASLLFQSPHRFPCVLREPAQRAHTHNAGRPPRSLPKEESPFSACPTGSICAPWAGQPSCAPLCGRPASATPLRHKPGNKRVSN
jgi:hypothetical protein